MVQFKQAQPKLHSLDNQGWDIIVPGLERNFFNFNPGKQDYNYKLHSVPGCTQRVFE